MVIEAGKWSTRLRSQPKASKRALDAGHRNLIKKEFPVFHNEDSNYSRTSSVRDVEFNQFLSLGINLYLPLQTSSIPASCMNQNLGNDTQLSAYWGPRRSARLVGIPAELSSCCKDRKQRLRVGKMRQVQANGRVVTNGHPRKVKRKSKEVKVVPTDDCCFCEMTSTKCKTDKDVTETCEISSVGGNLCVTQSNGSSKLSSELSMCLPLKKRRVPQLDQDRCNGVDEQEHKTKPTIDKQQDADNAHRVKEIKPDKSRLIEALLLESERFLHYPTRSPCRARSTYNSRDILPPISSSTEDENLLPPSSPIAKGPNLDSVSHVEFSFEIVPTQAVWYQTFQRDVQQHGEQAASSSDSLPTGSAAKPFLLPYEMSLEAILKMNRSVRKRKRAKAAPLFRPIISTRLQMQTAAEQSRQKRVKEKVDFVRSNISTRSRLRKQNDDVSVVASVIHTDTRRGCWFDMPRKSPRCHASTLAILCAKEDASVKSDTDSVTTSTHLEVAVEEALCGDMSEVLQKVLGSAARKTACVLQEPTKRKRGRPRKYPIVETPLEQLLSTPLDKIGDMVDEQCSALAGDLFGATESFNDVAALLQSVPECAGAGWDVLTTCSISGGNDDRMKENGVLVDSDEHLSSTSASVCESASDLGSCTSTGAATRYSTSAVAKQRWRKRKRNLTGWPRSKKRKPLSSLSQHVVDVTQDDDSLCDGDSFSISSELAPATADAGDAQQLSIIVQGSSTTSPATHTVTPHSQTNVSEDSLAKKDSTAGGWRTTSNAPAAAAALAMDYKLAKPFHFQRKTLKFVGKRILRPANQRQPPQRLEYWPKFTSLTRRRNRAANGSGTATSTVALSLV